MIPFYVNQQFHVRQFRKSRAIRPFRSPSFISVTSSTFPASLISHLPYLLPCSVSCKPFLCHSYENCRGVYQQLPLWNSPHCFDVWTFRPSEVSAYSGPIPFLSTLLRTLWHSQRLNPFLFNRFRTLCRKTPGGGVRPARSRWPRPTELKVE